MATEFCESGYGSQHRWWFMRWWFRSLTEGFEVAHGYRILRQGAGFGVRVWGLGFRVEGLGFRV